MFLLICALLFVKNIVLINAQISVIGDSCTRSYDGEAGECALITQCPSANRILQTTGIRPDVCGYSTYEPIVCCVQQRYNSNWNSNREGNKRISEQKCDEYSTAVKQTLTVLPLVSDPNPISFTVEKCDYNSVPLIVGGEVAKLGEFPHMAAIGWTETSGAVNWWCGGTLISPEYVLTAAHCASVNSEQPDIVRLGEHNLKHSDDGADPIDVPVDSVITHPSYHYPSKYNDIALVKLRYPVSLSNSIRPSCLWANDEFDTDSSIATGWGKIDYAESRSDDLLKVVLKIIDNRQCAPLYVDQINRRRLRNGIVDTQMCAGELDGGKDTCQGDSGGPLQITKQSNKCIFYIVGITSFGRGCGAPNSPGVYTRVSKYVDWIESVVWPN
ncbi:venom protease-like isoform X2 [Ctenocephalides felis]|uniref:venom protease-like n=1 Tax=Ctenocephalides felis TaxID=7515 RepID=UPI000E6E15E1|nr:venom protease-like [Ctenocephalides felis]XP_026474756.1 venom protease-like isoform X1 [Ctenocephalides felis]XP_026474757.1 venom protease-like isoform X2 [Ctenocephalides felis]